MPPTYEFVARGVHSVVRTAASCINFEPVVMCGRYITKDKGARERELPFLDVKDWPSFEASYNIAPTQLAPVVIATADGNMCRQMRFCLIPYFAKVVAGNYRTINARVEAIDSAASFSGPWAL